MAAFELIQSAPPSQVNALDEITENEFQEELYRPRFEFFLREGMPAMREFAKALDAFSINRNNIVLENVEAIYEELLKKATDHGTYYEEMRKALEERRAAFFTLVEDLVVYREYVKTTKKEIKFFPLLANYEAWLRSVVEEKPEGQQDSTEGKEQSLYRRMASTYVTYIELVYGADDFENLTNLALEQEEAIFMTPSRDLRNKRVETRFQHSSKEPAQIKEDTALSLPQYAVFSKYRKYFQGEKQTLPYLVPNEIFYKLKYEQQAKIINEIEESELFVKEDLSRVAFPETAKDRMLPRDPLARIHPALRVLADKDPAKIKAFLHEAATERIPAGQAETLANIAQKNTQHKLDTHLGVVGESPFGADLLNPTVFAEALSFYRAKYGGVLFTDKEIADRLKQQKEHEFEKQFTVYIAGFLALEFKMIRETQGDENPDLVAKMIAEKLEADFAEKFHSCVPLETFILAAHKEIHKVLTKELLDLTEHYSATNKPIPWQPFSPHSNRDTASGRYNELKRMLVEKQHFWSEIPEILSYFPDLLKIFKLRNKFETKKVRR